MNDKIWNVALYIRLSVEDGDDKIESNSISNQKRLLKMFVSNESDLSFYDEYVDDGYTGTNFNRPGFKKMLEDIKDGKVNAIIVKDLSRFGRNYIEVGNYIEQIFPLYNLRFIALNDNIDNIKDPSSLNNVIVPFKNLINDEYCRDISNKVKSSMKIKRRKGEYVGGCPIYGYIRDPKDKHHLIIDEEAANVVKTIFQMSLEGKGRYLIAKYLNENGILSPCEYKYLKFNVRRKRNIDNDKVYWSVTMIGDILKNRIYCGDMIQGKTREVSYKIHKRIRVPESEWDIVENTHEPIIDRETFNKVRELILSRDIKVDNNGTLYMFAGHLKCGECGHTMTKKYSKSKTFEQETGKKRYNFFCSNYIRSDGKLCDKHRIRSDDLEKMVLEATKLQISLVIKLEETIKEISKSKSLNYNLEIIKKNKIEIEKKLEQKKKLKKDVYEDWKMDIISQEEYNEYSKEYNNSIIELSNILRNINSKLEQSHNITSNDMKWIDEFKKRKNINELTRDTIDCLIDYVDVFDNDHINIVFRYKDKYEQALSFVEENK